ncbi:MAG: hypothetical protein ACPG8K_00335 [Crocinitomicaceae bacterium]
MKKLFALLALFISMNLFSQDFVIEQDVHPYYDVLEWKGMGALLMSKDPNANTKQITLSLIGDQETTIWDQKFNPKGEDFYYIASENARYVYFLDNLDLQTGKIYFSQLNSAGNIKSTNVSIYTELKKIGAFASDDIEFIDAVVTDKALVHLFRIKEKKSKEYIEVATFVTHHNFRCYASELGRISFEALKDEDNGHWRYIGFTGDQIYFAAREKSKKEAGYAVKQFSSKGEPSTAMFIAAPEDLLIVNNIGFGTTGAYYADNIESEPEKGLLTNINGKFYLTGGRVAGNGAELVLFHLFEGEWEEVNKVNLNYFIEKKGLDLGVYPMNEGIGYHLDHNGYDKVSMLYFEHKKTSAHNDFMQKTVYNPSSVFVNKEKNELVVLLENLDIIRFKTDQLGKEGPVTFNREK